MEVNLGVKQLRALPGRYGCSFIFSFSFFYLSIILSPKNPSVSQKINLFLEESIFDLTFSSIWLKYLPSILVSQEFPNSILVIHLFLQWIWDVRCSSMGYLGLMQPDFDVHIKSILQNCHSQIWKVKTRFMPLWVCFEIISHFDAWYWACSIFPVILL